MAEPNPNRGKSKCGWCLTNRCEECHPSGVDWECVCTHDNKKKQQQIKDRTAWLNDTQTTPTPKIRESKRGKNKAKETSKMSNLPGTSVEH